MNRTPVSTDKTDTKAKAAQPVSNLPQPKKWYEVYPYGTKEGDEEAKVFRALGRHGKYDWRSTGAIVKATGLSRERVEEIIDKYVNVVKPALIYAHPSNEDHWGYWERVPEVLKKDGRGISQKDKDARVDKHITGADMIVNDTGMVMSDNPVAADMVAPWCAVTGANRGNVPSITEVFDRPTAAEYSMLSDGGFPQDDENSLQQWSAGTANLDVFYSDADKLEEIKLDIQFDYLSDN